MNTSKAISTISFNTEAYLYAKLNELVDCRILSFYSYIKHYGEPNESNDTKKDHYHIYIEPNKRIDTSSLKLEFNEHTNDGDEPLKCLPFQNSKFDDWYYYCIHDPIYLARKGMNRLYSYKQKDIVSSDKDFLLEKVNEINTFEYNSYVDIYEYQNKGYSFQQYAIAKNIHPMQIKAYSLAWEMVWDVKNSSASNNNEKAENSSAKQLIEAKNKYVD